MRLLKIPAVRATTIALRLEAPLRHANGGHWGRLPELLCSAVLPTSDGASFIAGQAKTIDGGSLAPGVNS